MGGLGIQVKERARELKAFFKNGAKVVGESLKKGWYKINSKDWYKVKKIKGRTIDRHMSTFAPDKPPMSAGRG